jgi:hypothetical protein
MEYRKKLAGLIREASQAVLANEAMASDLATIAYALDNMPEEKFASFMNASVLEGMFNGAKPILEGVTPAPFANPHTEVSAEKSQWDKKAFTWNEKAAALVKNKLVSAKKANLDASRPDAVKATLTPEQTPDGSHNEGTVKAGVPDATPAAITKEQTPNQEAVLTSDILKKSEAPVQKEAGIYTFAGIEMSASDVMGENKVDASADAELKGLFQ